MGRNSGAEADENEHKVGAEPISRNDEFGPGRKTGSGQKFKRFGAAEAAAAVQPDEGSSPDTKGRIAKNRFGQVFVSEPVARSDENQDRALPSDGGVHGRDDADAADEIRRENRRPR